MTLDLSNRVDVDFGFIPLHGWCTKVVTVSSLEMIESVKTCPKTNPLSLMFKVDKWENMSDGNHEVTVTYHPRMQDMKNYAYFQVNFHSGKETIICAKGETKAPKLICKTQRLTFHCSATKPTLNNKLELVNITDITAKFHFDVNPNDSTLTLKPNCGNVPPKKTIRVLVTFKPDRYGLYFRRISCLLKYQAPILIDLYGIYTKCEMKTELSQVIYTNQYNPKYMNNYECYLSDILRNPPMESLPLLVLSRRFIDFGYFNVQYEYKPAIQEFELTNTSMIPFKIRWEIDKKKCFRIVPNMEVLSGHGSVTYKAKFFPKLPDNYYNEDIVCSIFWGPDFEFLASYPVIVNLIGNTFEEGKCSWDPQYDLSAKHVILPSTVPNMVTYTTLTISRTGHLPVFFKFEAPKAPKFVVKPTQGLITSCYQIIIVRLYPGVQADVGFVENWELILNITQRIVIKFSASAELPALKFANNACLTFPSTNVHSIESKPFAVRNCTRLPISLSFRGVFEQDIIYADQPSYELSPNLQISPIIHFYPHHEGEHSCSLVADLVFICNDGTECKTHSIITVNGLCERAKLIGFPEHLILDNALYSDWVYGKIYVNNPSFGRVNAKLGCKPRTYGSRLDNYSLSSEHFVLDVRETKEIELGVQVFTAGRQYIEIYYYLTKLNDGVLDEYSVENHLIKVDVYCQYPSVKFEDLRIINEKINFSKYFYWEMLQINKLNEALSTVEDWNKPKVINTKAPENEQHSKPFIFDLLVRNTCGFDLEIGAKIVRDCTCPKFSNEGRGISLWKSVCKHKSEFKLSKNNTSLKSEGLTTVRTEIHYETTDKNVFQVVLSMWPKWNVNVRRSVTLLITRKCFPSGSSSLDVPYPELDIHHSVIQLDPIFIGDINPPVQAVWLYNNSVFEVPYKVSKNNFKTVFRCINRKGNIPCCSTYPLLIKFTPYELKRYTTDFWVVSNEKKFHITVYGDGVGNSNLTTQDMSKKLPLITRFTDHSEETVLSSVQHIVFKPLPIHSSIKSVIFIKNNTKYRIFFHWKRKHLGGIYNIQVMPEYGLLQKSELIMCQVELETYSIPARITDYIVCVLINYDLAKVYLFSRGIFTKLRTYFDTFFNWAHNENIPHKTFELFKKRVIPILLKVGISFYSIDEGSPERFHIKTQFKKLRSMALGTALQETQVVIQNKEYLIIRQVFEKLLWEVLKSNYFLTCLKLPPKEVYYLPLATHQRKTILAHTRIIQKTILHYAFDVFAEYLSVKIEPNPALDECIAKVQNNSCCVKNIYLKLNNKYYKDILEKGLLELESHFSMDNRASCDN